MTPQLCESDGVGTSMTRATVIWFVAAVVTGTVAAGLHVLRSEVGGTHDALALAVAAWLFTGLTAVLLYRGIMTAAGEQDEAERRRFAGRTDLDRGAPSGAPGSGGVKRSGPTGRVEKRGRGRR